MSVAVIMTCHNRRQKTLACLESLYSTVNECDVYLTDDGSTDGTAQAVRLAYPRVRIIEGDGNLFWSRGMRKAWQEAVKTGYDYYLWLNDDVELCPEFFSEMLEAYHEKGSDCIITGIVTDKASRKTIYGGCRADKSLIEPAGHPEKVMFMNGNIVLVPDSVVRRIGVIDGKLHHDLGDVDYGLTALENGIGVYTTGRAVAVGHANDYCRVRKWGTDIKGRFTRLNTPLGSPLKINYYFRKKHFGIINAALFCGFLVLLNILPDSMVVQIWNDKYRDR